MAGLLAVATYLERTQMVRRSLIFLSPGHFGLDLLDFFHDTHGCGLFLLRKKKVGVAAARGTQKDLRCSARCRRAVLVFDTLARSRNAKDSVKGGDAARPSRVVEVDFNFPCRID